MVTKNVETKKDKIYLMRIFFLGHKSFSKWIREYQLVDFKQRGWVIAEEKIV